MRAVLICDDYKTVRMLLDQGGSWQEEREALAAFERIRLKHQELLDACARVTSLANGEARGEGWHQDGRLVIPAVEIRRQLGAGYLGGHLLNEPSLA